MPGETPQDMIKSFKMAALDSEQQKRYLREQRR
jgi:hypothetical protein